MFNRMNMAVQKGESLDAWATHVRPSFIAIWQVLSDLMQLLAAMHASGTVHRDLKPGNVLWRPRVHEWTLIDFGCAADTGALLFCWFFSLCYPQKGHPMNLDCSMYQVSVLHTIGDAHV